MLSIVARIVGMGARECLAKRSVSLAMMSHDILPPMNGVLGMSSILLNEEQRRCVETIQSSSESLLRVINDVLDFARRLSRQSCAVTGIGRLDRVARQIDQNLTNPSSVARHLR